MYAKMRIRFFSLLLVLSVLISISTPAVQAANTTALNVVEVATMDELLTAVSEASSDTVIDLVSDITTVSYGGAISGSGNTDFTVTITSSTGKKLIVAVPTYIQNTHIAFFNMTVEIYMAGGSQLQISTNAIVDIYNSTFKICGSYDYILYINDTSAVVNLYSGTFDTSNVEEPSQKCYYLSKGTLNIYPTGNVKLDGIIYQTKNFTNVNIIPQEGYEIRYAFYQETDITDQLNGDEDFSTGQLSTSVYYNGGLYVIVEDEEEPPEQYTIDTSAVSFFSAITIDGAEAGEEAKAEEGQEVKIALNYSSDYELTSCSCIDEDGQDVAVTWDEDNKILSFEMPASNVTVSAQVSEKDKYTLTRKVITDGVEDGTSGLGSYFSFAQNSVGAGLSPSVFEDDTIWVTYTVADGYFLSRLAYTVEDGETVDLTDQVYQSGTIQNVPRYRAEFTMPAGNVTVTLEFTRSTQRRVICQPCEGGSITADKELVTDDTIKVFPAPDEGYRVSSVEYSVDNGETWSSVQFRFGGERVFWIMPAASTSTDPILVRATFANNTTLSISDEQGLRDFAEAVNHGDWHEGVTVTLENDIALHGLWTPIGNNSGTDYTAFAGTFDGCGHTVSGLSIEPTAETMGFFGVLYEGTVKNLTVEGKITVTGQNIERNIGSIAATTNGWSTVLCQISNCVSRVDIYLDRASAATVGGIVGSANNVEISDCVNWGNIDAVGSYNGGELIRANDLGGIAGMTLNYTASIVRCANYGNMTCDAGEHSTTSSTTGTSNGERWLSGSWGGIVGWANSGVLLTLDSCFNRGSITGDMDQSGGLIGHMFSGSEYRSVEIKNSYNAGALTSTGDHDYQAAAGRMGGLLGQADSQSYVVNSYSSGVVTVEVPPSAGRGVFSGPLWSVSTGAPRSENCYSSINIAALEGGLTPALLNPSNAAVTWNGEQVPIWKEDLATDADGNSVHINGGNPMLYWESTLFSGETGTVHFSTTPADADVVVYANSSMDETSRQTANADGSYTLYDGLTYYYKISAQGYAAATGSFTVDGNTTVTVALKAASVVTFKLTPSTATMTVTGGSDVAYDSRTVAGSTVEYVYTLVTGTHYFYSVDADGYAGTTREFTADGSTTISLALETSNYGSGTSGEAVKYIYGDGNPGEEHEITSAGTYSIGAGATGTITINTSGAVTLIGRGAGVSNAFEDLYIDCAAGTNLTLEQVYISNTAGTASMIDFTGTGNTLTFSGTNILDQNTGATGYAMIHVGPNTSLTLQSKNGGTAYLYKREQGAGIGGNGSGGSLYPEYNGDITISGLTLFIKGSKQGALIGGGAGVGSSGSPGSITILNSDLNLLPNAQGAAIGSGAGNENSIGPDVTVSNSMININVNFDAAAIGGGGYKSNKGDDAGSNDADGGTLTYLGNSSIRAYIDRNGVASWNVDEQGVNGNKAITANVVNSSGQKLYLLELDTTNLPGSSFNIKEGGTTIYSGGLHQWGYVNENLTQGSEASITYTIDNWVRSVDPHLYLYLTGEPHTLTVGSATVKVEWTGSGFMYEITSATGEVIGSGSSGGSASETGTPGDTTQTTVAEGTVTTTVGSDFLAEKLEGADAGAQIVISPDISEDETVHTAVTVLTRGDVGIIAENSASLKISSPLADIVLSNQALQHMAGEDNQQAEQVTITASIQENGTRIEVAVDDKVLDTVDGGLKVTLPVLEEELTAGCVMVLVDAEGNETVIKKSALDEAGVTALLDGSCTVKVVDNTRVFDDVYASHWYADAVAFAAGHELFNGISETEFDPTGLMTRGMLVTVLHRLEDAPETAVLGAFRDVEPDSWFTDAVHWASENGIVMGYDEYSYGPNDSITREQMVVMMYRYVNWMGLDVSASGILDGYADRDVISDWAEEAIVWAVGAGLMEGKSKTELDPAGTATRAEVATILQRFISLLIK